MTKPQVQRTATRPTSKQDRSRRTEQALLDAALALFAARGVEDVTVTDIAEAAGVAPATIYRRFGDKEGLVREAFARFTDDALRMLELAPVPPPRGSFVGLVAEATVLVLRFTRANERLLRSSYAKALEDDFYASRILELRRRTFALLKRMFLGRVDEMGHPHPERAIDFALRQSVAMLSSRLEAGRLEVDEGAMDDAAFVRELLRSLLAYLEVPHTPRGIDAALTARGL